MTLLVVDSDDLGEDEVQYVLERTRYPNHCIAPRVMETRTREVDWSDDHPLNGRGWALAAEDLFAKGVSHG